MKAGFVNKTVIVFVCDGGISSSVLGARILSKKLMAAGIDDIAVTHANLSEIPADVDIVFTHHKLKDAVASICNQARIIPITNCMTASEYDDLVREFLLGREG